MPSDELAQVLAKAQGPDELGKLAKVVTATSVIEFAKNFIFGENFVPEKTVSDFLRLWVKSNKYLPVDSIKQIFFEKRVVSGVESATRASIIFNGCYDVDHIEAGIFLKQQDNAFIENQISVLGWMIELPHDLFSLSKMKCRHVVIPSECPTSHSDLATSSWNCYDLFEYVFEMIGSKYFDLVKPIFEKATRKCPDFLCIALTTFSPPWNSVLKEILIKLCSGYIMGQQSSNFVLSKVWQKNPQFLVLCMVEVHRKDPLSSSRLLDVALELKMLNVVLTTKPYSFAIDLAILASRRQHLNLEKWIAEMGDDKSSTFFASCMEFIHSKLDACRLSPRAPQSAAYIDSIKVIVKVLRSNSNVGESIMGELVEIDKVLGANNAPVANQPLSPVMNFLPEIENIVNGYFESLFSHALSPVELVESLRNLRTGSNAHERQIYDCLIRNLFEEFKFFPNYPEKELETVSVFVGQLIGAEILNSTSQGTALAFILESLRKPLGSRLFMFAQVSISQFYAKIFDWPQFLEALMHHEHFEFLPDAVKNHLINSQSLEKNFTLNNIGQLNDASTENIVEPPNKLKEKVSFLMNNLTGDNLSGKADSMKSVLTLEFYPWFVEFILLERILRENNLHTIFWDLVTKIECEKLVDMVMACSVRKARTFIQSFDSIDSEARENIHLKTAIKNISQWIGLTFFSKNRPIMRKDLCLKSVLTARVSGEYYSYVLPFVCRLLEKSTLSTVFTPSNPWIAVLLRLIVEIYYFVDLKLNAKFEIELLFKGIGVDMKVITPSSHIRRLMSYPGKTSPRDALGVPNHVMLESVEETIARCIKVAKATLAVLLRKDKMSYEVVPEAVVTACCQVIAKSLFIGGSKDYIRDFIASYIKSQLSYLKTQQPQDQRLVEEAVEASFANLTGLAKERFKTMCDLGDFQFMGRQVEEVSEVAVRAYYELAASESGGAQGVPMPPPSLPPTTTKAADNLPPRGVDISATVATILAEIEVVVERSGAVNVNDIAPDHELKQLMRRLVSLAATDAYNRDEVCLLISQKLVQILFRTDRLLIIDIMIVLLAKIFEYSSKVSKEVTNWILMSTDERKYSVDAMTALLGSGLVYVLDFDVQLAKQVDASSSVVLSFAVELIRRCVLAASPPIAAPYDLVYSLEALGRQLKRLPADAPQTKAIVALMEDISKKSAEPQNQDSKIREVISFWFSDWFRLCQYPSDSSKQVSSFLGQLAQKDFCRNLDRSGLFFRVCSEVAVDLYLHQKHAPSILSLRGVDCYVRLAVALATMGGAVGSPKRPGSGIVGECDTVKLALAYLLNVAIAALPQSPALLQVIQCGFASAVAEIARLQQQPQQHQQQQQKALLAAVLDVLEQVGPRQFPAGLANYIDIVSSKHVMRLFVVEAVGEEDFGLVARALEGLVDFISRPANLQSSSAALSATYQGVLRLFVGIAHDRPDLVLSVSRSLIMRLDRRFMQLRNLILATVPSGVSLPDPFSPDFTLDRVVLSGSSVGAIGGTEAAADVAVIEAAVAKLVGGAAFDVEGWGRVSSRHALLSSVLLSSLKTVVTVDRLAGGLAGSLKAMPAPEDVYLTLFHLADNLRYPSPETVFFIRLFLSLFGMLGEAGREVLTRVLLERLIAHKPHPWGLIVTFLELIRRPELAFWSCSFTTKTPEIRKMFESVARTCGTVAPLAKK